jgi:hypothetical protein
MYDFIDCQQQLYCLYMSLQEENKGLIGLVT